RVQAALKEFNYIPNKLARSLKLDKTETLGLIIPDIANPYFAEISKSIEATAKTYGYSIILCDSDDDINTEEELLRLMLSRKVDGVIIAPVGTSDKHLVKAYQTGLPMIIIDRFFPESNLPFISSDNFQGAYDAVQHFIEKGHQRIACIQGIQNSQPNIERVRGYKQALKDNGISFENDYLLGDSFSKENGFQQLKKLFKMSSPPTAVFTLSNLLSLGVMEASVEMKLHIPDDFSLISFDEQPYSAYLSTPMTTVNQQKEKIGSKALEFLVETIDNPEKQQNIQLMMKTKLIIRDSVKRLDGG
ncbi:MAG: LacI family DNA-binding transcriptional regulator, partial [Bacteroidota bacterium]